MKRYDKKAFFGRGFAYSIAAIAALTIGESWLLSNRVLANPALENTIALKIDNLKQSDKQWIEIDLSQQHLFAWSGKNKTFSAVVSTGKAKTPTHPGVYTIQRKYPLDRMRGADYDLPDVPSVLYFDRGYALEACILAQ